MGRLAENNESILLRRLRLARIAILLQGGALVVLIGLAAPNYFDQLLHPLSCAPGEWCMDLRGLEFELSAVFLGPPALLLVLTAWLWRRPRKWPAALPLIVDVAFIALVVYDALVVTQSGHDQYPSILAQAVFGLIPAVVSLAFTLPMLRRTRGAAVPPRSTNITS